MFRGSALPAFFDTSQPTDPVWSQLEQAASTVPVVAVFDDRSVLASVYDQVTAAGVTVFGYVDSKQGQISQDIIGANIDTWFSTFPNLAGMFVDEGPPLDVSNPEHQEPAATLAYYQFVYQRIKTQRPAGRTAAAPTVMLNCGGMRDTNFVATCLDVALWEQDYPTYKNDAWWQAATGSGGQWWTSALASVGKLVAHVVNAVPQGDQAAMQNAIALAVQRHADYIYVFDGSSSDYGRLPTFWSSEVSALAALTGGGTGGLVIARPQSPAPAWHVHGAADAAAALARPVQQPNPVDASQYIWGGGTAGAVAEVSVGAPAANLDPPQSAQAWFYANTGSSTTLLAESVAGGQVLASATVGPGTGFAWHEIVFPQAPLPAGEVFLRFTVIGGGDSNVRAAYVQFATTGHSGGGDPRVSVFGVTDKVRPTDAISGSSTAQLTAAGNEYAAFQVAVHAADAAISNLNVAVPGPLSGPGGASIPTDNVRIYRVAYYTSTQLTSPEPDLGPNPVGRWPDPLIPVKDSVVGEQRNAFPITVPQGENRLAWIDILVPAGTPAGLYTGSVQVTGNGLNAEVPVQLTVLAFTLPSTGPLNSGFLAGMDAACAALGYNIDTPDGWRCLAMFVKLALDNRISIATVLKLRRGGGSDERPNFERILLPLLTGAQPPAPLLPPLLPDARPTGLDASHPDAQELGEWRDEANAHGLAGIAFVYDQNECDEIASHDPPRSWNPPPPSVPTCLPKVRDAVSTWPQAAILLTATINDITGWEHNEPPGPLTAVTGAGGRLRLTVVLDQIHGQSGTYAGDQSSNYQQFLANPSNSLWLYTSCDTWSCTPGGGAANTGWAGYAVDLPGPRARALGWLCFRYDATGELYWDTTAQIQTAWTPGGLWNSQTGGNGDGTLFYPGTPNGDAGDGTTFGGATAIPVETIRLKLIRHSYQDYAYLTAAAQNGKATEAKQIAMTLFPSPYQTPTNDAAYIAARQQLAALI